MPEPPPPRVRERLRELPSVDRLATSVARAELAERRAELLAGAADDADLVARARERLRPSLRRVLNATGVVVHTNLGRAPLAASARAAVARGGRGLLEPRARPGHAASAARATRTSRRCCARSPAREAGAGGQQLRGRRAARRRGAGRAGREVVVSRGQLIEIGGGFRIPEVVAQAGARLVEVGTTNRTRLARLRARRSASAPARSCARTRRTSARSGFTEEVEIEALCGLGVPVDRRRRLRRAGRRRRAAGRRAGGAPLGARRRGARVLQRRQAARRPAGAACIVGTREAVDGVPAPPAGARRAHRQALARRARGDARALPRPRARARARSRCWRCSTPTAEALRGARRGGWPSGCGGEVVALDREGRRRRAAAARAARPGGGGRRRAGASALRARRPAGGRAGSPTGALLLDVRTMADEEVDRRRPPCAPRARHDAR